ncbi:sensor histidine kinase [Streptomyces sp. NBC_01304]|uniref:sensor histidine kinase n=1 Tax=Streptomyces sp. NBC_01304 TaxID=2903818 RepID=UPI002E11C655|nr:HAMP domain-containing histidine kinase [Streptomyces sp. NBC_01304]
MRRPSWLRKGWPARTLSIHTRLFLGFAGALAVSAALMVAIIYSGMRFLPTYDFQDTVVITDTRVPNQPAHTGEPLPEVSLPPGVKPGTRVDGSISSKEDVWNTVLWVSVGGLLLVMTIGLLVGWRLSKRLLAPLGIISQAAAQAADGRLDSRINAQGPADELKQLADTFDTMLARLEESFAAHQRFAANASHELLTPLATTRAVLQVAVADPTGEEFAELAPMLVETNERNITIVKALLDLAAAEHTPFDPEPVDLADLAEAAAAERAGQAAEAGIRLETDAEADCTVSGNTTLLRQLVLNLLDNALRYNVPGGSVHLAVLREQQAALDVEHVVLEVENTGPYVDEAVAQRLFEPFYRLRPRVASDRSGHGLGLAIVRSVGHAHHGTVTARANPDGGLTVRVELPAGPGQKALPGPHTVS